MEPAPYLTLEEKVELAKRVHSKLHDAVPETLSSVVGGALAEEGVDILYEVVQNDIVLRSISYQLLDLILLEAFPDLKVELDALHSVED